MVVTFILNVEDNRRKAKNFSENLTRGVKAINEAEAEEERIRDDVVTPETGKSSKLFLSPQVFNLVVRDFELGFDGDIVSPEVGLITQIGTGEGDPDDNDYIDIDISDNVNPRVNLNVPDPLAVVPLGESFASSVLTVGKLSLEFGGDIDIPSLSASLPGVSTEIGREPGELNLHKITLTQTLALDSKVNIQLPDNMVTSPDFDA